MTKTIFEEMGGIYRQVGDYLLPNITVQTKETECIGLWGQWHARHLKEYHKVLYMNLLTSGKLYRYLVDVDRQAGDMFLRLVKEYADRQGVTEQLKAENPHEWIGRMNNIQACVREVVGKELIYI
ncbi:TnpV protein [Gallintestinimicrobium propionicum]|uniref:TnpV protein n=1 Tax=Gallintestinimicrobium propionicum TaxID=2981770 RepID=UPI0032C03DAD